MSVQWMDNFRVYGGDPATMLEGTPWSQIKTNVTDGIFPDPDTNAEAGSKCFVFEGGTDNYWAAANYLSLPSPSTTIGVAFRLWMDVMPAQTSNMPTLIFKTSDNRPVYNFEFHPNGSMKVYNSDNCSTRSSGDFDLVAETVVPVMTAGNWVHWEFLVDTTTGDISVWRENVAVGSVTTTDVTTYGGLSQSIAIIAFAGTIPGGSGDIYSHFCKDLIIYDGSGSVNNGSTPIGTVVIYNRPVDGDVSGGWSQSTGTESYVLIDEEDPSEVDYISADSTPPAAEVMTIENLPADVVTVKAVMPLFRAMKSDSGDATLQVSLTSNGSDDNGADRAISTSISYYWDISELDPDTATAWTPSSFNAATVKVDRTT